MIRCMEWLGAHDILTSSVASMRVCVRMYICVCVRVLREGKRLSSNMVKSPNETTSENFELY